MTNQEILTKAIQEAIDGGWKPSYLHKVIEGQEASYILENRDISDYDIIFDHDFAKALFGEVEQSHGYFDKKHHMYLGLPEPAWQYHLQQMVIAEDPIKYLGENL